MSVLKNVGLQVHEYVYDFAVDGGAVSEIVLSDKAGYDPLPVGAMVQAVKAKVLTAFAGGSLEWGNGDDADGYSGAAIAAGSLTANALFNGYDNGAALLWDDTNDHPLEVNVADADDGKVSVTISSSPMTAGKLVLMVYFYAPKAEA